MTVSRTTKNTSAGFTLLEVMFALAIIAATLVVVLGVQSQSLSLATETKFSTTAVFLAQHKMAEVEAGDPEDLMDGSGDFGEDFPGYRWDLTVSDTPSVEPAEASDYLQQLDLTVSWGEESPYQYKVRLYRFASESR
jgi:general secretion pathway protein I